MKLLLIALLMLLCGCTAEPYAEMSTELVEMAEEMGFMSRWAVEDHKRQMPVGTTLYEVTLDNSIGFSCTRWDLQRYYAGEWYTLKGCSGELDITMRRYPKAELQTETLRFDCPPLQTGYYRVAFSILVDDDPGIMCAEFVIGSIADFRATDLPVSDRVPREDKAISITVPREIGCDATEILYAMEAAPGCDFLTGCSVYLERQVDGQWCQLPTYNLEFEVVGNVVAGGTIKYETIGLTAYINPLEPGRYRIIKDGCEDWGGEEYWIAGEFDVTDCNETDHQIPVPEGLRMSVSKVQTEREYGVKSFQVELTAENDTTQPVYFRSNSSHGLQEDSVSAASHDHLWRIEAGESDVDIRSLYIGDEGLFNKDGSLNDGIYQFQRKVTFEDGRWCILDCEFTVRDGVLATER